MYTAPTLAIRAAANTRPLPQHIPPGPSSTPFINVSVLDICTNQTYSQAMHSAQLEPHAKPNYATYCTCAIFSQEVTPVNVERKSTNHRESNDMLPLISCRAVCHTILWNVSWYTIILNSIVTAKTTRHEHVRKGRSSSRLDTHTGSRDSLSHITSSPAHALQQTAKQGATAVRGM